MFLRQAGIAAATLLLTSAARSADPQRPVRFDYAAEQGCPVESDWVKSTLSRAPAARVATPDEPAWTLKARIAREGNRFAGRLQVVTPEAVSDTRRFRGNSCEQVALALAIAAALSVDPEHGGAAPAVVEPPPPVDPPPAPLAPALPSDSRPPERVAPPPEDNARAAKAQWSLEWGAAALLTHGIIDSTMWGGEVVARLRPNPEPPVALRLSAGYAQSLTIDAPPGEARFYLPNVGLLGCVIGFERAQVSLGACGGARAGLLLASGLGVNRPNTETRGWLSWMGGLNAQVGPLRGLRAEIAASLVARQTRYTYTFDRPPVTITDPPWLGWELSLGVVLPR